MTATVPYLQVACAPRPPTTLADTDFWRDLVSVTPFLLADGRGPARQQTRARLCYDSHALYVRFDCEDRDIWGTFVQRDDPIYDEEVIEVMISPGRDDPTRYFEFEVSPNAVLFDAIVYNPSSTRADLQWDAGWNCPDLEWTAERSQLPPAKSRWLGKRLKLA